MNLWILFSVFFVLGCKQVKFDFKTLLNPSVQKKIVAKEKSTFLIKGAKVYTVSGETLEKADVLIENGLISKVSKTEIKVSKSIRTIDAKGLHLTPGLIDVHSHMGVYAMPSLDAHSDGNEMTKKATPEVNAKDSFWPQDPALWRALEGGVTVIQVLPGSANLVGGESFIAKLNPKTTASEMKFLEAPRGIKMACGENPKRVYGKKGGPSTRMGNAAGFRELFQKAKDYAQGGDKKDKDKKDKSKKIDFSNVSLGRVLSGETFVNLHCYRADDIATMIEISKEFGFKIRTVHHGLEAYKLKDLLAKEGVAVATWADWWGFKAEAYDGIPHNIALLEQAGARPIVHSDSEIDIRFLNVEAAKAWRSGLELGLEITENQALSWITKNPAWALGVEKYVGTVEVGKHADLVLWDGHPLSGYSKTQMVFVNGELILDRKENIRPVSDFELGYREKMFYDGREFNKTQTVENFKINKFNSNTFSKKLSPSKNFVLKNVKTAPNAKVYYDFLIEDGIISKIEKTGAYKNWSGTLVDGEGKLLTAGLIETASTLGLFEIGAEKSASDRYTSLSESHVDLRAKDALNLESVRIPITRKEGVTTNFSYVMGGGVIQGQGVGFDLNVNSKTFKAPLLTSLGKGYSEKHSSRAHTWKKLRKIAREVHNYKQKKLSDFEKKISLTKEDYQSLLPYFEGRHPWVFEVDRLQDIKSLISFIRETESKYDFKIKPILMGGAESWLVASELRVLKIPVVIKPTELVPANFDKLRVREDLAAFLVKNGVDVVITSGATRFADVRRLRQEMGFALKYGLSWKEGLRTITETPARMLNLNDRGALKVGYKANMVLWSGDLVEPHNTALKVWIGGKQQSLMNRQRLLAEKYL